jgi:hypothetical protein
MQTQPHCYPSVVDFGRLLRAHRSADIQRQGGDLQGCGDVGVSYPHHGLWHRLVFTHETVAGYLIGLLVDPARN